MTIRFIPSLPRGGIVSDDNESTNISSRNGNTNVIKSNLGFMTQQVTGSDGTIYTWVETKNKRTGFNDSSGYSRGNLSGTADSEQYTFHDEVGAGGSYILKLGFDSSQQHRWLRGVVGFDLRVRLRSFSTSSTNDPWIGKIGLIYHHPTTNTEFIYRPTVTMIGSTGDINIGNYGSFNRLARKLAYQSDGFNAVHDLGLLFTGFIFEFGHSTGGGAVPTDIYLNIKDFKPIFSTDKQNNPGKMDFNNIKTYELLPKMRPYSERDNIEFDPT